MRISGMLRIYWNINTPIKLKSGQSIPLGKYKYLLIQSHKLTHIGLYPKSLGVYEMNEEKIMNENGNEQQQSKVS
jgi:hypothetical protein